MRADLAPLLVTALYVVPGAVVLWAAGLARPTVPGTLAALGLAYVTGVAVVLLPVLALLCLGVPARAPVIAAVAVLAVAAAAVAGWRLGRPRPRGGLGRQRVWAGGADEWIAAATIAAIAVYAVVVYRSAAVRPLAEWDSWSLWARKGALLLGDGTLPTAFLTAPGYAFMHPDYPMLLPLLESVWFRVAGSADTQGLHAQLWILFVAGLWAAGYLAARVARPALWAPVVGLLAVTPAAAGQLLTAYADVPMCVFLALGVLALGLWLAERRTADLALAALLLAAAASTKNEGLTAAVVALVAAIVVAGRRALVAPLIATGAVLVAVAPWRIWLAAHDLHGEMPIGNGLNPSYLADRLDRVWPSVKAAGAQLSDTDRWNYLLPLALGLVVVCLITGLARRLAAFYALAGVATFASIIWAYWISPTDLTVHLRTSVDRTVDGVVFVAVAALLHLGGRVAANLALPSPRDSARPRRAIASISCALLSFRR